MNAVVHTSSQIEQWRLVRMVLEALPPARGPLWLMSVNNAQSLHAVAELAHGFGVVVVFDARPLLGPAQFVLYRTLQEFQEKGWKPTQAAVSARLGWPHDHTACVSAELAALRVVSLEPAREA